MKSSKIRKTIGVILLIGLVSLCFFKPVQSWIQLPDQLTMMPGEATSALEDLEDQLPYFFSIEDEENSDVIQVTAGSKPIKHIEKEKVPKVEVIPGGQSVGVRLSSKGVMVVGFHLLNTEQGQKSPAEAAGIQKGDIIVKIDQQPVEDMTGVTSILKSPVQDKEMQIELIRNGEKIVKNVQPSVTASENSRQLGMYIRDSAAGVGTMTFFEPTSGSYGALGHAISDVDTKRPVTIHEGEILRSAVKSIERGGKGMPGEKQASLLNHQDVLGTITKNNTFGIYGKLNQGHDLMNEGQEPMPIAYAEEVEEGPAKILTVVENEEVEEFDVEVIRSSPQKHAATKGMVIKVTDERLLEKTGGIIQGMSGSPIIQDDKIIGAVTHVFVNDASAGYGSHIEWMLEEAGVDTMREERKAS
ncbi:stage IV sporulation protein B [Geomicrobium halophilum]|uniref:Stage IV sporulation protein B n=1 Tax=Geomicrobium halophilum TaxID=549000 RepID=A0A841Q0I7_9BACL|nr:stage IV sporulation protein B [Geomicrobium halophilum]